MGLACTVAELVVSQLWCSICHVSQLQVAAGSAERVLSNTLRTPAGRICMKIVTTFTKVCRRVQIFVKIGQI